MNDEDILWFKILLQLDYEKSQEKQLFIVTFLCF